MRTRQAFDEELHSLEQRLLQFGAYVEAMVEKAMRALQSQNARLGQEVIAEDDLADQMDLEIEQRCMKLLALQQPMASDLRFIGTTMKVIADVERIGDYAVDIAKVAVKLASEAYFKPLVDIPRMGEQVRVMLRRGLEALVRRDLELVTEVAHLDEGVDSLWRRLRQELERIMQQQPATVPQAVSLLLVARYLERIADHTVNIVERVTYMETGHLPVLDVTHGPEFTERNGHGPERPRSL